MHSTTFDSIDLTSSASSVSIDGHDAASVTIPDAHFLFHADFKRTGSDLTLTGEDGHRVVVPGYFTHEHLPTLLSPEGAALTGDVIEHLVGSRAPCAMAWPWRSMSAMSCSRATSSRPPAEIPRSASSSPTAPRSICRPTP